MTKVGEALADTVTVETMTHGVIFDLDETLLDRTRTLEVYASSLWDSTQLRQNTDRERFVSVFMELDGNGRSPKQRLFDVLCRRYGLGTTPRDAEAHFYNHAWLNPQLMDGALALIDAFRGHWFGIGIVTNGSSTSQRAKLENSGLIDYVDAHVISGEFGAKKPERAIYDEVIQRLDIDPRRSWFVGDDPMSDVWGPSQVGFKTAWVERALPWPSNLRRFYTQRFSRLPEVATVLGDDRL